MSFSLLGGTIRRTHNTCDLYAATVKPGGISRRRNLNSWKREEEEAGERASNGGNRVRRGKERRGRENRNKRREGGNAGASSDGYTRIMQINRNPNATKRVPINSEMSPVKIQARREARCSPARTRANLD